MNTQTHEPRATPTGLSYPSDKVVKAIIYSLEEPLEPQRRNPFTDAIGQHGIEDGWWFFGLWTALMALTNLVIGWYSDNSINWTWFWIFAVYGLLAQVFFLLCIWYTHREARVRPDGVKSPTQISVRSLRRAALAGDDHLAPPVTDHESASASPDTEMATITVLPPKWRLLRILRIAIGICAGVGVLLGMAQIVAYVGFGRLSWEILGSIPPFLLLFSWLFIVMVRASRSFRVEVRPDGVYWEKHVLPWSEVRGWFVISMRLENMRSTHPNTIYALVGRHKTLSWLTYPPEIDSQDPGKRLAQLVQTRVNLPLRDLTPAAICISEDVGGYFGNTSRLLAVNDRYVSNGTLPRLPIALITTALSVVILLCGILTPYGQQWYFGRQLAQLETARSAVRNPLTANTLHWTPVNSYYSTSSFVFTPGGYAVSGKGCCDTGSFIAQPVSNGLVEVTIRQQSSPGLNEAGILFRANSYSHTVLVFTLSQSGYWLLERYSIGGEFGLDYRDYLASGSSVLWMRQPIHQGHDSTNRLAVLMQGSSFIFFINGQYVGRYQANDEPSSGQVGVYVEGTGGPTTFSNLLISPA